MPNSTAPVQIPQEVLTWMPRIVTRRNKGASVQDREELLQSAYMNMLKDLQAGKLHPDDPTNYWLKRGIDGMNTMYCFWRKKSHQNETVAADFNSAQNLDGLEEAERRHAKRRRGAGCDPEGGACDARLDFYFLSKQVFAQIKDAYRAECHALAEALMEYDTLQEASEALGWTRKRTSYIMKILRDAFIAVTGKAACRDRGIPRIDREAVKRLHARGWSQRKIAKQMHCTPAAIGKIVNSFNK